ncbi:MAG: quercetin dioxygenase-like cupin family protein [Myxococcota bacterium]|jgi:quercetin dioxygenase-like cupin family protein
MTHRYEDLLDDVVLGTAPPALVEEVRSAALTDPVLAAALDEVSEIYGLIGSSVDAMPAPAHIRNRLVATIAETPRFERFTDTVARILEVATETAAAMIAGIDRLTSWEPSPWNGIQLYHLEGGPVAANAIVGFVRIAPGEVFPMHKHLGDETVFVLQGRCVDNLGSEHGAGELVRMPPDTEHELFVPADSPEFIYLAVVQEGIETGGMTLRAGDPNI